jgi:hypothetical protein
MENGSDPFSESNDPNGLELEDYKNQLKERRTAISKLEANKIPLYAFWSQPNKAKVNNYQLTLEDLIVLWNVMMEQK